MRKNLNPSIVLVVGCSLRMLLDPALTLHRYGFSQSRYVVLNSLSMRNAGRSNGRDGERPFFFLARQGRSSVLRALGWNPKGRW